MRSLFLSAAMLALVATPALAQNGQVVTGPPGLRSVEPLVHHPTNLNAETARSRVSPALPQPGLSPGAPAEAYLHTAEHALRTHRLGLAQSALGHAETALLNRSMRSGFVGQPHRSPAVETIDRARQALGHHDIRMAMDLVHRTIDMTEHRQTAEAYPPPRGMRPYPGR